MEIDRPKRKDLKRFVGVLGVFIIHSSVELPAIGSGSVLCPKLIFNFSGGIIEYRIEALIISRILEGTVVEHVSGSDHGPESLVAKIFVIGADGIVPLRLNRQIIQDIALLSCGVCTEVERKVIQCAQAHKCELVALPKLKLVLILVVIVSW